MLEHFSEKIKVIFVIMYHQRAILQEAGKKERLKPKKNKERAQKS
jgi:hypothetical protein